jgi:FdhD protein
MTDADTLGAMPMDSDAAPGSDGAQPARFLRITRDGAASAISRDVAEEVPVAIEYNGIGYAVLMTTPVDIEDLVTGFSHAERLIDRAGQIEWIEHHRTDKGYIARVGLVPERAALIQDRTRSRFSDSSCGLCGIENLDQAIRTLPTERGETQADDAAIQRALEALFPLQALNRRTGAVHAAALCSAGGTMRMVREDVGRHNAFDKLIGAMLRNGLEWEGGFALLSSRCSYELVEKAALAGAPMLVTISAPTSLALDAARQAHLPLVVLARADAMLRFDGGSGK